MIRLNPTAGAVTAGSPTRHGTMAGSMWREGAYGNETAVQCCGCGSTIAVAESRVAGPAGGPCVFSCSSKCEQDYEEGRGAAVGRQ